MFQEQENPVLKTSFSADFHLRISISGLAYCRLKTDLSTINFLRHVQYHELSMKYIQKIRGSETEILSSEFKIEPGHNISITPSNSTRPGNLAAPVEAGEFPLDDILNLTTLHGRQIHHHDPFPPVQPPSILSIHNCAFYTISKTQDEFQIIETNNRVPVPGYPLQRRLGYTMGGKIRCGAGNVTTVKVEGPRGFELKLPQAAGSTEFVYEIIFNNHCANEQLCRNLMGDDTDFRFYYDLLTESPRSPDAHRRKFKLKKAPPSSPGAKTPEVAACNVVIIEPPKTDPPPHEPLE